MIKTRC